MIVEIELPTPPSVNHYYRRVGYKTLISREGRKYREKVCHLIAIEGLPCFTVPVYLEIEWYPPDKRRRDVDNILKPLLDSLQHGRLLEDDALVKGLWVERYTPHKPGRVIVRVREV
jgi:crossover junction endodeoxyribonuclease RusA